LRVTLAVTHAQGQPTMNAFPAQMAHTYLQTTVGSSALLPLFLIAQPTLAIPATAAAHFALEEPLTTALAAYREWFSSISPARFLVLRDIQSTNGASVLRNG